MPLGSISGYAVDEYGAPAMGCTVTALQSQSDRGQRRLGARDGASTNDKGEYRIQGLEKGRYYVALRCSAERVAPHPLMPLNDPRIPHVICAPQLYPGTPDVGGAALVKVGQGESVEGIDFAAHWTSGVMVRGQIEGMDLSAPNRNVRIELLPARSEAADWRESVAIANRQTGEFRLHGVVPGSYLFVAFTIGGAPVYCAETPLTIAGRAPDPILLALACVPVVSGTLELDGDTPPPIEGIRVLIVPMSSLRAGPPQAAPVSKDGTFALDGVMPGKWRLRLLGSAHVFYVKSLTVGEKDVSPYGFEVAPGAMGQFKIVAGTKVGQVQARLLGAPPGEQGLATFLLVPADASRLGNGLERSGSGGGEITLGGVVPGRYRLFAFVAPEAFDLNSKPEVLQALENHGQLVDVKEGGTVRTSVELIGADELKRVLADVP